jgi:hypothetical protein
LESKKGQYTLSETRPDEYLIDPLSLDDKIIPVGSDDFFSVCKERIASLDLAAGGKSETALIVFGKYPDNKWRIVAKKIWATGDYKIILSDIRVMFNLLKWAVMWVDESSFGSVISNEVIRQICYTEGLKLSAPEKISLYQNARQLLDRGIIELPSRGAEDLIAQLVNERITSSKAGNVSFQKGADVNDLVWSFMINLHGIQQRYGFQQGFVIIGDNTNTAYSNMEEFRL